jgi:hypothetical protein
MAYALPAVPGQPRQTSGLRALRFTGGRPTTRPRRPMLATVVPPAAERGTRPRRLPRENERARYACAGRAMSRGRSVGRFSPRWRCLHGRPRPQKPERRYYVASRRCTLAGLTPNSLAVLRMLRPLRTASRMPCSSVETLGLPNVFPAALTRAKPAFTRSWIIALSNSAKTPSIWNIALPLGVVVSTAC